MDRTVIGFISADTNQLKYVQICLGHPYNLEPKIQWTLKMILEPNVCY